MAHIKIPLKVVQGGKVGDLLSQGWIKKTTIGEPRLTEVVENYKMLGYEVYVIEHIEEADGCNTCFTAGTEMGQMYGDVYIRESKSAKSTKSMDDELF